MELSGNTVLITGGSEGIGFEMARALVPRNTVVICGRGEAKLAHAKEGLPEVHTEVCDVTDAEQRTALVERVTRAHPELNILINNAGGRERVDLAAGRGVGAGLELDVPLNFVAPAALCGLLLPHLQTRPRAAVVNMSTGLVYLPKASQAFYSAAKAALHSYTQSLRWALRGSPIQVFEVLLTLVDTHFHRGDLPQNIKAISAGEAARITLAGLAHDREEVFVGKAGLARLMGFVAPVKGMAIVNG